jgi:hypothetical protein
MLTYEEIVVNLKILEKIEKYQKLNTQDKFLNIETKSIVPEAIRRWRRGDDRNNAILQIQASVTNGVDLMTQHPALKKYLSNSVQGIENLKITYSGCSQTCARLDTIIDKIREVIPLETEISID